MKSTLTILFALLMTTTANTALAGVEAVTINGKRVMLNKDHSWEYIEDKHPDTRYARLSVANLDGGDNYCRLGLRLKNDLADKVTSIIFMFSAYVNEEVRYETVTKGFQHVKPTNDMYNEITFSGITCGEIEYIRVHGADRCEIGELNKFTVAKGQCLKLVEVEPSDKVVIFKRYEDKALESIDADETEEESDAKTVKKK